jgi:UDP-glucose 4,6-dehydratase
VPRAPVHAVAGRRGAAQRTPPPGASLRPPYAAVTPAPHRTPSPHTHHHPTPARRYPNYRIVNFDKLDYCSSLKNLEAIQDAKNYTFVKVRASGGRASHSARATTVRRPTHRTSTPTPSHPPPSPRLRTPPTHTHTHTRAQGNITSADLVSYVLRKERIDTIMHFAAQTHVDNSFGNSFTFTESNIMGTHVLLEAAKEARHVKLFIHVSTDEVYGEGSSGVASHEGSMLEPTNPYAATKAGAEHLVRAYERSFGLPVIITRGNNVYGPHQYPEKIIPKFVNQLLRGLPLTLHGTGENTRNYLYVEDVARAFDIILHQGKLGEVYNIGGTNEKSNIDVARTLLGVMGVADRDGGVDAAEAKWIVRVPDRPFNDLRYPLDCSKLLALGWKEQVAWDEGLAATVAWYKRYSGNWRLEDVEAALVAHPRRGLLASAMAGYVDKDDDNDLDAHDPVAAVLRERSGSTAASPVSAAAAAAAARSGER